MAHTGLFVECALRLKTCRFQLGLCAALLYKAIKIIIAVAPQTYSVS